MLIPFLVLAIVSIYLEGMSMSSDTWFGKYLFSILATASVLIMLAALVGILNVPGFSDLYSLSNTEFWVIAVTILLEVTIMILDLFINLGGYLMNRKISLLFRRPDRY